MKLLRHFLVQRQLDAFADTELVERYEVAVLRHLDECVDCVTELELIVWTKSVLAEHATRASGADFGGHFAHDMADSAAAVARLETWARKEVLDLS